MVTTPGRRAPGPRPWAAVAVALGLALLFGAAGGSTAQPAQSGDSPCDIHTTERVVAVGDVHGAYDRFVALLRAAGLIDRRDRWSGGRAVLIQTGDVVDRGGDSRRVLDLLRKLQGEAARAGGRVHALIGNHEFMRLVGDWRYVSAGEFKAFENVDSADLRDRAYERQAAEEARRAKAEGRDHDAAAYRKLFLRDIPLGWIEMRLAFEAQGVYGRWVRARPAAVKVNGVLFLHGGVSDALAAGGCQGINDVIRRELAALPVPPEQVASLVATSENGPLWYRGLATEPEPTFAPTLTGILDRLQARAIVIGHTPVSSGRVTSRFGGRVLLIDTGMLNGEFYPGGAASALELHGDTRTAIYTDRREVLRP